MVNKCSVNLCPTKPRSKITFFPFPLNNTELCDQWIQTCCRDEHDWTPVASSRVCEFHFTEVDYETIPFGKTFRKRLRDGIIPSQNLPPGAPLVVTLMGDGSDEMVSIQEHVDSIQSQVELEEVVTDGTHYDTMDHVEQDHYVSMTVEEQNQFQDTMSMNHDEDTKIQIVQVEGNSHHMNASSKPKKSGSKSTFDPTIPDDIASNTMNIDHGYFLSFMPQQKVEPTELPTDPLDSQQPQEEQEPTDVSMENTTTEECQLKVITEDEFPNIAVNIQNLNPEEKIEKLVHDLKLAYRKNRSMAKANKSLRLQLHQASKKTLSMKSKHEVAREVLAPFFTPTQIDCFCRPKWLRSRNWTDKDFENALALRRLMSKKAFGFLRKKRMIPMPSLTSLRKYQRINNIIIHHPTNKGSGQAAARKAAAAVKKTTAAKNKAQQQQQMKHLYGNNAVVVSGSNQIPVMSAGSLASMVQNGNVMVTPLDGTGLIDASGNITFSNLDNKLIQTIQIPVSSSNLIDDNGQPLQLQVLETIPNSKMARVRPMDDNWKFIQISSSADGSSTYTIEQIEKIK